MQYTVQIEEKIKQLPDKLQVIFHSDELAESLRALAKKYKIYYDKWELLEKEIILVLLSVKSPDELPAFLASLGLDAEKAQNLLSDLIEHIFKPMRKLLKEALDEAVDVDMDASVDPRAPQFHGKNSDPRLGENLDKPFNIGEIPEITDPYREKIEF